MADETTNNELGGGNTRLVIFGGLLVAVVMFLPRGIIPTIDGWLERRRTRGRIGPFPPWGCRGA